MSFDNGAFSEHGTFSISDWVDLTPKDQVLDYLTGAFPVTAMDAVEDEDGAVVRRSIST